MQTNKVMKGFSLIELMVAILITIIMVGGFVMALNSINTGTRNAARTSDLTNLSRGVFNLMQTDFYNASKGISDMNMYQIHINSDLADSDENLFYGITNLTSADDGESDVELQWFNYHRKLIDTDEKVISMPTFQSTSTWVVVDESAAATNQPWDAAVPPLTFISAQESDQALNDLKAGDFFILYRADMMSNSELNNLENLHDKVDATTALWEEDKLLNGAMLLQAVSVDTDTTVPEKYGIGACLEDTHSYHSARKVHFGGTLFSNSLGTNIPQTNYSEADEGNRCIGKWLTSEESKNLKQPRPPEKTWLARKVGEHSELNGTNDHNRVRYYRDVDSDTLIRVHNGEEMIVASNVDFFEIQIGLDVTNTTDAWDGAVSIEETDNWITNLTDVRTNVPSARALIHRHALAVKIIITFKSLREDIQDKDLIDSGDAHKRRTFEQIIR